MKYQAMGRCGLKLSALSLGGWTTFGESITDAATVRTIIRAAYEHDVNFFDMADAYARGEAERVMGKRWAPVEETVRAMDDLVWAGKVLDRGTSEWPAATLQEALELAGHTLYRPQVEQSLYHPLSRRRVEQDIAGLVDRHGLGVDVWGPLAFGLLTGKYDDGLPDGRGHVRDAIETIFPVEVTA